MQFYTGHNFEYHEQMPMYITLLGRRRAPGYYLWGDTTFATAGDKASARTEYRSELGGGVGVPGVS